MKNEERDIVKKLLRSKGDNDIMPVDMLKKEDARTEAEVLRREIREHDRRYYEESAPEISDAAYDRIFHRLEDIEAHYPRYKTPDSPTVRVGGKAIERFQKISHPSPLLSLQSSEEEKKVRDFLRFVSNNGGEDAMKFTLEPKYDGFSIDVAYRKGALEFAATRGDGYVGEDVTENIKRIRVIPLLLHSTNPIPDFLAVRGEIFMPKEKFQSLNAKRVERGEEPFANPRNAAAGMMRLLDPKRVPGDYFSAVFYDVVKVEGVPEPPAHSQTLKWLSRFGLKTSEFSKVGKTFDDIKKHYDDMRDMREKWSFEIDGMVIKVDSLQARTRLGVRERNPRWAYAWKFEPKEERTTIEKIVVQVGRSGKLTPVALLDPVDVGGVTVSRATLHNEDFVHEKDLREGDVVEIVRAGDVIPEVRSRVGSRSKKRGNVFHMPKTCPVCGSEIVREGSYHLCPAALTCPAQQKGRIIHFASRKAMNIDGLGEKVSKQLVETGLVGNIADLYALSVEDILGMEGFAEKSATQLYNAIQEKKEPAFDRFLYSLGIPHVGEHIARVIAREYGDLKTLKRARYEDLVAIHEVGPEIAESIVHFFQEEKNREVLESLRTRGVKVRAGSESKQKNKDLAGLTFVFTGNLTKRTRDEATRMVIERGARASSSVSKKTDYVVAGDGAGSKLDQAKKLGVHIISEKEFEDRIGRERKSF